MFSDRLSGGVYHSDGSIGTASSCSAMVVLNAGATILGGIGENRPARRFDRDRGRRRYREVSQCCRRAEFLGCLYSPYFFKPLKNFFPFGFFEYWSLSLVGRGGV